MAEQEEKHGIGHKIGTVAVGGAGAIVGAVGGVTLHNAAYTKRSALTSLTPAEQTEILKNVKIDPADLLKTERFIVNAAHEGKDFATIEAHIAETYKSSPGVVKAAQVFFDAQKKGEGSPTAFVYDAAIALRKEPMEAAAAIKAAGAEIGFLTRILDKHPTPVIAGSALVGAAVSLEARHLLSGKKHAEKITVRREAAAAEPTQGFTPG